MSAKEDSPGVGSRLEQLRHRYGKNLPKRLAELRAAAEEAARGSRDSSVVTHAIALAHRFAGTAGTYGFSDAAALGAECERMLQAYQATGVSPSKWEWLLTRCPPGQQDAAKRASRPTASASSETQAEVKGCILVVDDDEEFLTIIAEMLRDAGYAPITTSDTRGLHDLIESSRPDLLLLDVEMPQQSGVAVCRAIREQDRWLELPIVFLTARSAAEDRIAAFHAGADDFINKPIVAEELRARVEVRVERSRMARERQVLLQQAENQRDSLLSLLDRLRIGTLLLDAKGRVQFLSRYCDAIGLDTRRGVDRRWDAVLPLDPEARGRLRAQLGIPLEERLRLNLAWTTGGQRYFVECEVQDAPGAAAGRILCLTDVSELRRLQQALDGSRYGRIIGDSAPMRNLFELIEQVAQGDWTVLIEGETGTGKELVAHSIHEASSRKHGPFVAVNSAGLSESLLASQLFGHRKGSFTGAVADQEGFFEAAGGGTLFLDEIGDLPLSMQASLLRVLQEREILRIGEVRPRKVDVRILAATHRDLASEAREGRFRQDLLYRLRVARIHVPALRERRGDIPLLAESFRGQSQRISERTEPRFSREATQCLMSYDWPGNVRELKAVVDFAVIHSRSGWIEPGDLPPEVAQAATVDASRPGSEQGLEPIREGSDERARLLAALQRAGGNRTEAAKLLGVSRATFYRRLTQLGIEPGTT